MSFFAVIAVFQFVEGATAIAVGGILLSIFGLASDYWRGGVVTLLVHVGVLVAAAVVVG